MVAEGVATVTLETFTEEWLSDVRDGSPSSTELGRRFAWKLVTQWLDTDDAADDLVYCDGAGDGGIDVAYLDRGESHQGSPDDAPVGDTWYLAQSKYGSAFRGSDTIVEEGRKVVETLDGQRQRLSSLAEGLLERLTNFRRQASDIDRIVLVLATEDPLTDGQRRALDDVRAMGRERFGPLFDVSAVSVATIYLRQLEELQAVAMQRVRVEVSAELTESGEGLLVGSIPLLSLYDLLRSYRSQTDDLDQLYEKNVRRFLGSGKKVNKAMQHTLEWTPERFGLYNNGITIVVEDFEHNGDGTTVLIEPYIVNGCQTTKTIWNVFERRLDAGGTGVSAEIEEWKQRAQQGVVVAKIVKVGSAGEDLVVDITRYTNSQNAVREKDFLGLSSDFRSWARQMAEQHNVFLEVQRGGWDSQKAYQKQRPSSTQFTDAANAFDLLKVYGAGWLAEAGTAYGRNAAFLPTGAIFRRITDGEEGDGPFGVDDLYAAHVLQHAADEYRFGRSAAKITRRQTRFLFYLVVIELLKEVLARAERPISRKSVTGAVTALLSQPDAAQTFLDVAVDVIDSYLTEGTEDSVFDEPAFKNVFNNDLNGYLKWERLGKTEESSPRLRTLLAVTKRSMGHGNPSPRELAMQALNSTESGN